MRIGGLAKFSLIDYPGRLAAVIFTQGCPFRCDYCHNPELVIRAQFGPLLTETEVLHFLNQRRGQLEGVVLTGGEPTLQPDLLTFIRQVKVLGYSVKLDTMGLYEYIIQDLLTAGLLDYVAMDIKAPLAKYPQVVHYPVDTVAIQRSIQLIMTAGIDYEFRTTVVPALLSPSDLREIGRLLSGAKRYILQTFVPTKTNNPTFLTERSYPIDMLAALARELEVYVEHCICR